MSTPLFTLTADEAVVNTYSCSELTNKIQGIIDDALYVKEELNKLHKNVTRTLSYAGDDFDLTTTIAVYKLLVDTSGEVYQYIRDMYLEALNEALKTTEVVLTDDDNVDTIVTLNDVYTALRRTMNSVLTKKYPILLQIEYV